MAYMTYRPCLPPTNPRFQPVAPMLRALWRIAYNAYRMVIAYLAYHATDCLPYLPMLHSLHYLPHGGAQLVGMPTLPVA